MSRKSPKQAEPEAEEAPITAEIEAPELNKAEAASLSDAEAAVVLQAAVLSTTEVRRAPSADSEARIRELEEAILRHRETAWKVHGPHRPVDRALYAVLAPVGPSA